MRRSPKLDANHNDIVKALRSAGASVLSLASIGLGAPDLAVGFRGHNYLLEVKNGSLPPSHRRLTTAESTFFQTWRGNVQLVSSIDEALIAINATQHDT